MEVNFQLLVIKHALCFFVFEQEIYINIHQISILSKGLFAQYKCGCFLVSLRYPDNNSNKHNLESHLPEGHNVEWTFCQMSIFPNEHLPK